MNIQKGNFVIEYKGRHKVVQPYLEHMPIQISYVMLMKLVLLLEQRYSHYNKAEVTIRQREGAMGMLSELV